MIAPLEIRAIPHPWGHRIDLEWVCPDPLDHREEQDYAGLRIMRRQGTWPTAPDGGDLVIEAETADLTYTLDPQDQVHHVYRLEDEGLAGETVFYYTFFLFTGDLAQPVYDLDVRLRAAAMATAPYDYAGRMATLLPAVLHRYDHEEARLMSRQIPAELLQKLALEDQEKGPLRRFLEIVGGHLDQLHSLARSALDLHDVDKVDGRLLPLLAHWIGWPTDHRLELRAQRGEIRRAPYVYHTIGLVPTVEASVKRILGRESRTKEFAHNVFLSNHPARLNLWLAERQAGTWTQPKDPLSLHGAFEGRPAAAYDGDGKLWFFFHTRRKRSKVTWSASQGANGRPKSYRRRGQWDIWYKTLPANEDWTASQPLTDSPAIDKHPSAALQDETLWVFWDTWSESDGASRLSYRTRREGVWSRRRALWHDDGLERRRPQAVVQDVGGGQSKLWLFWQERVEGRWQVRYNRHDGTDWELPAADAGSLWGTAEDDPRTEEDLFAAIDQEPRLWVFWARRERSNGGRWRIAYRIKSDLVLATRNWGDVLELPADPEADDREPAALVDAAGNLELYRSSNRDGTWSVWRTVLPLALDPDPPEQLTGGPFSQRAPLAVAGAGAVDTLLFFHSNENLTHADPTRASKLYGATRTVDGRYAGSTTADARNVAKAALRAGFDDFQAYTFDTGTGGRRREEDWYAHDTVGLYLPLSEGPVARAREHHAVDTVLRKFLPVQVRAVPIPESSTVARIFCWSEGTPGHRSIDFTVDPVDTSQRTWDVEPEPQG